MTDWRKVGRHRAARCPRCGAQMAQIWNPEPQEPSRLLGTLCTNAGQHAIDDLESPVARGTQ